MWMEGGAVSRAVYVVKYGSTGKKKTSKMENVERGRQNRPDGNRKVIFVFYSIFSFLWGEVRDIYILFFLS